MPEFKLPAIKKITKGIEQLYRVEVASANALKGIVRNHIKRMGVGKGSKKISNQELNRYFLQMDLLKAFMTYYWPYLKFKIRLILPNNYGIENLSQHQNLIWNDASHLIFDITQPISRNLKKKEFPGGGEEKPSFHFLSVVTGGLKIDNLRNKLSYFGVNVNLKLIDQKNILAKDPLTNVASQSCQINLYAKNADNQEKISLEEEISYLTTVFDLYRSLSNLGYKINMPTSVLESSENQLNQMTSETMQISIICEKDEIIIKKPGDKEEYETIPMQNSNENIKLIEKVIKIVKAYSAINLLSDENNKNNNDTTNTSKIHDHEDSIDNQTSTSSASTWSKKSEIVIIPKENYDNQSKNRISMKKKKNVEYVQFKIQGKLSSDYPNLIKELTSELVYVFGLWPTEQKDQKKGDDEAIINEFLDNLVFEKTTKNFSLASVIYGTQFELGSKDKKYLNEVSSKVSYYLKDSNASKVFFVCCPESDNIRLKMFYFD